MKKKTTVADECSFCVEWQSTVIIQDYVILHVLTAKRLTCALSEHCFKEKPSFFDKPVPKSNLPCLATSTRWKNCSFSMWVCYIKKNHSDGACRVVHSSPCCMFHASICTIQSKKFCGNFHFLVTTYLLCVEMTSSCLQLADEYSFCAERHSTTIVRDDVILAHTDCKQMGLSPIRAFFQGKAILFWQTCPKV